MAIKNIAIACQGGGSHAAYTAGALPVLLTRFDNAAIARHGGKHSALNEGNDGTRTAHHRPNCAGT